jgi:hypothetical protein
MAQASKDGGQENCQQERADHRDERGGDRRDQHEKKGWRNRVSVMTRPEHRDVADSSGACGILCAVPLGSTSDQNSRLDQQVTSWVLRERLESVPLSVVAPAGVVRLCNHNRPFDQKMSLRQ